MTIELTRTTELMRARAVDIAKVIFCGYGRLPEMLDLQLCPETLIMHDDGSHQYLPHGLPDPRSLATEGVKTQYGRCLTHGPVTIYNAIPPRGL